MRQVENGVGPVPPEQPSTQEKDPRVIALLEEVGDRVRRFAGAYQVPEADAKAIANVIAFKVSVRCRTNPHYLADRTELGMHITVATRAAVSNWRRGLARGDSRQRVFADEHDSLQAIEADPQAKVEAADFQEAARQAMVALPPRCKRIFVLVRIHKFTHQQVADHLGVSKKTVEKQIGIAMDRMQQLLAPYLPAGFTGRRKSPPTPGREEES